MAIIDLGTPPAAPRGLLESLPRRISLTLPELRVIAESAGGAPLPFDLPGEPNASLGGRLGRPPASAEDEAYAAALEDLEAAKESRYREIREAEMDYRTGKLSEADWKAIDRQLRAEAVELLRRLDALGAGDD